MSCPNFLPQQRPLPTVPPVHPVDINLPRKRCVSVQPVFFQPQKKKHKIPEVSFSVEKKNESLCFMINSTCHPQGWIESSILRDVQDG